MSKCKVRPIRQASIGVSRSRGSRPSRQRLALEVVQAPRNARQTSDDERRWQAVIHRDRAADGSFFYSVRTTGVYCRPTCPSRLPRREHVRFHSTCRDAQRAGFRACKRCHPTDDAFARRRVAVVVRACRLIDASETPPSLDELSKRVGMSASHFHRSFKAETGVTPKAYAAARRTRRVRSELPHSVTVTDAIYRSGFNASSRFYETSSDVLGMAPQSFRAGGRGTTIRFAVGECWLGSILVAATEKGICAIFLGDDPVTLVRELQDQFAAAELLGGDARFEGMVARVVGFLETPEIGFELPLDIRGTVFQQRVWDALRRIRSGSTATYTEIAARIGRPKSIRAVAGACAANVLAVAIPCHRVVRNDGKLSGYRWGVERKGRLLERERAGRTGRVDARRRRAAGVHSAQMSTDRRRAARR